MASALFVWLLGFGGRPIRGAAVGIFSPICVLWIVALAVVRHWAGGAVTTAWMADSLKPFISTGSSLTVILPKRFTKFEISDKTLLEHTQRSHARSTKNSIQTYWLPLFFIQSQVSFPKSCLIHKFYFNSVFYLFSEFTLSPLCCHWVYH